MPDKYLKAISEVKANDELKNKIVLEMKKTNKNEGGFIMKIRKVITTILAILSALVCSGAVYAGIAVLTGKDINDLFAWAGIKFSDNYNEYVQVVENEYVEDNGIKIELRSKLCDEGFVALSFDVILNEEQSIGVDGEFKCEPKLSFNEEIQKDEEGYEYLNTNGANYNVIIDGEEIYVKSSSLQSVETIIEGREYRVYQLWFLPSDKIENKEKFVITLDNIVALFGDRGHEKVEGKFEIEISKEKALSDTTYIETNNAIIDYKGMKQNLERCVETPLQNLIRISTNSFGENIDDLTCLLDEDYVGTITYKAYDQNDNELLITDVMPTYEAIIYEDGTKVEFNPGESRFEDENIKNVQVVKSEYIVVEKNENIKKISIEVYEENEYYGVKRKIGNYYIDLENKEIKSENCNNIVSIIIPNIFKNQEIEDRYIKNSQTRNNPELDGLLSEEVEYVMQLSLDNGNAYMKYYDGIACVEGEEDFIDLVATNVTTLDCNFEVIEEEGLINSIKIGGEDLDNINPIYDFIEY